MTEISGLPKRAWLWHSQHRRMQGEIMEPDAGTRKIAALVWALPVIGAVVVPGLFILMSSVLGAVFYHGELVLLGVGVAYLVSLIWLARYHAQLRCRRLGIPTDHPKAAMLENTLEFFFFQCFMVIFVWVAILMVTFRNFPLC